MKNEYKILQGAVLEGFYIKIVEGRVMISGVDMGGSVKLIKAYSNGWHLAKVDGGNRWCGRGMASYEPTTYYLFKVQQNKIVEYWEGEFGKSYKDGIKELEKKII